MTTAAVIPDTQQEESYQRTFTPAMRTRRRLFIWGLYLCLGAAVAVQIVYVLHACEWILKLRTTSTVRFSISSGLFWTVLGSF